jgi:hypothetical protein
MVVYNLSDKITNSFSNVIRKQILYEKVIEFKGLFFGFVVITSIMGFTTIINGVYTNYLIWNIYKDIQEIKNANKQLNEKINTLNLNNERNEYN